MSGPIPVKMEDWMRERQRKEDGHEFRNRGAVLPEPVTIVDNANGRTVSSTVFAALVVPLVVMLDLPAAAWVDIEARAWISNVAGGDLRIGVDVSGATTSSPSGVPAWGTTGFISSAAAQTVTGVARKLLRLNAGVNRIEMMAMRSAGNGAANYAALTVNPIRFAGPA